MRLEQWKFVYKKIGFMVAFPKEIASMENTLLAQ